MYSEFTKRLQPLRESFRLVTSSGIFHLFVSMFIILLVFLHPPAIFSGDTDTARNYLNTIVSSLSTILALCISIILVAIQLTASNYTHRVLDFFVRLPYNISLFLCYLVTIMHSFFLMAKIQDPVGRDPLRNDLRPEMSADLVLVVICFVSLLVYMYAVVQLLKPERIIELILREYNVAYSHGDFRAALDNVEQICDIAKRGATFSDSVTGMRCMDVMLTIAARLPLPQDLNDPLLEIHQNIVDQWVEIVGVAVKEKETGLLNAVLDALYTQGEIYVKGRAWQAAELVIRAYRHLSFNHLLAEGQVFYTDRVAERLYRLAYSAAQADSRGQTFSVRTWNVVRIIGENTFSASPSSVSSLLEGFLLSTDFQQTMTIMENLEERKAGTVFYFELWKSFAGVAPVRDTARWAIWWRKNISDVTVCQEGKQLALLLAAHVERPDEVETLCHVWGESVTEGTFDDAEMLYRGHTVRLFDGWPWRKVVERTVALASAAAEGRKPAPARP